MNGNDMRVPMVYISPEVKNRLDLYIHYAPGEISGLGKVIVRNGSFFIEEIILFEQTSGTATTELSPKDLANFLVQAIQQGIDPVSLKLWWHSHGNGSTFWSHIDDQTAQNFDNGWMLSLVGNKQGEYRIRLDMYEPVKFTLDNLPLKVFYPLSDISREVEEEVRKKLKKQQNYTPISPISFPSALPYLGRRLKIKPSPPYQSKQEKNDEFPTLEGE